MTTETIGRLDHNEITFPKLGIDLHLDSTAFSIGGLDIQWYGILITLGLVLAMVYAFTQVKKYGLNPDRVMDCIIGGIIGGVVGARAYYVLLNWNNYAGDWKSILNIREGGLAIYGGIIGSFLAGLLVAKIRKVKFLPLLDIVGIGFLLAGLYRLDRTDSVTAPSNISIYGNFTTEKFVLLRFSGDNIYNHNKQRLSYSGAFVYFPGAFYGVGYNAGKEGYAQDLTTTMGAFRISYCTSLVGRFYIGVSGGIDYSGAKYKNSGMADRMNGIQADVESGKPVPGGKMGELYNLWQEGRYDPAKQDPFSNYIATTGDKPNAFNANVGLFAQYDTRDVTFNASKGIFIKAEAKWYPQWLGNTRRNFGRFTLTFDFYQKLWKGAIFAYDLYADCTAGTPSWHMYAKLGGMERMRGYYEGRYRDKRLVETQIELRQKIYRRHGIVGWIGGGQVWGTEKFRWGNTLCSFGCGYRFEFKNRMNIRLDYGWGNFGNQNLPWDRKRSSAFLFTASEAF